MADAPGGAASEDVQQVDDEDQGFATLDDAAGPAAAVAHVRRDGEAAPAADLHPGHALVPAGDDPALAQGEFEGLVAVEAGIELAAVGEPAGVVHGDKLARCRLIAITKDRVGELQAGWGGVHVGSLKMFVVIGQCTHR